MRVWLSGRALASQAEGRGFDPRHPLTKKGLSLEEGTEKGATL